MLNLANCLKTSVAEEFADAELGDPRRTRRLQRIVTHAMANPAAGFPQMFGDGSELEGLYRFLRNENVDADDILEPHINATFARMRQVEGPCLVAHDTTDFVFGGLRKRAGLGVVNKQQQGFLGHFALAVIPGEERLPLGVCGLHRIVRDQIKGSRDKSWWEMANDPTRESLRWLDLVQEVEEQRSGFECIHLMDREGDNYDLFALHDAARDAICYPRLPRSSTSRCRATNAAFAKSEAHCPSNHSAQ